MVSSWQGWHIHTPLGEPSRPLCCERDIGHQLWPDSTQEERYTHPTMVCPPPLKASAPLHIVPLFPLPYPTSLCSHSPPSGFGPHLLSEASPDHPSPNEPYLHRIFKSLRLQDLVTYYHCLVFPFIHSFHKASCTPTGRYSGKGNMQGYGREEVQPFLFPRNDCSRSEDSSTGIHDSW